MMLRFHTYDVFTDRAFAGNPLAIVEGADGLSDTQMQTIAREFNLSETIFVQTPDDPAHTAKVRIFFPTAEIPFAGHPTIGCALHLAKTHQLTQVTLEEAAGLVPVVIRDGAAQFTAPVIPCAYDAQIDLSLLANALDLNGDDLGPHTAGVHEGGPRFLYVPVKTDIALARARPIEPQWSALMAACDVDSAYLYTPAFNARMFSPTAGIPEDPATGSASAILASQLLGHSALPDGTTRLSLTQGVQMGRPSRISFEADVANGALTAVRIGGTAVPISSGTIAVP
ncbi:PhzF family phenazine biosynthesis protein [Nereida sp. MMG025]|uniref:PhzF family phenazine biosynthesis protein n=1 Tax=Nereida sp. MMG025 TaxID=2909981 RepID=UPI001F45A399|nr:PhzF family phenazine biosynthesis protein [Nereida sp. MMG025]MCF6443831.1 PhzF family phenazine biosynthesis protein [Nereida sp. MMG025]